MTDSPSYEPESLLLAGYMPLKRTGFALPCYGTSRQSNVWYTARASISGDHFSKIAGFDLFPDADVTLLPADDVRAVRTGAPWQDVFLVDGDPFVGTPAEVWTGLEGRHDVLAEQSPLSTVDLALDLPSVDRAGLIHRARSFLTARRSPSTAAAWNSSTLISATLVRIKRHLSRYRLTHDFLSDTRIEAEGDHVRITIPEGLEIALASTGEFHNLKDELEVLAREFGHDLVTIGTQPEAHGSALPKPPPYSAYTIGIVPLGPRARELTRSIGRPHWMPVWYDDRAGVAEMLEGPPQVTVIDPAGPFPPPSAIGTLVLLLDEQAKPSGDLASIRRLADSVPVVLYAPALPIHGPTPGLSELDSKPWRGVLVKHDISAVIDTSLARSPFWPSEGKRTLDRTIADIVVQSAALTVIPGALRDQLTSPGRTSPRLLQFSRGRSPLPTGPFRSEAFGERVAEEERFHFWTMGWNASRAPLHDGVAVLVPRRPFFDLLAGGVVQRIDSLSHSSAPLRPCGPPRQDDAMPGGVDAAARFENDRGQTFALSVETPRIEDVREAEARGWTLLRYTDEAFFVRALNGREAADLPLLPEDMQLGPIYRLPQNRGLAVRGVDIRDVVQIRWPQLREWRRRFAKSPLDRLIRRYRPAIEAPREQEHPDGLHLLPALEFMEAIQRNEPSAEALQQITGWSRPQGKGPWPKRRGDLMATYSDPAIGAIRYVMAEDRLPVALSELADGEVPGQQLFQIDGDYAAPALLLSRAFRIWAYATLTRSRGWSSRFSISRTFEGMPLPKGIVLVSGGATTPTLCLVPDHPIQKAAAGLRGLRPSLTASLSETSGAMEDVDRAVLAAYDLPFDATDLQILESLLAFNRWNGRHRRGADR